MIKEFCHVLVKELQREVDNYTGDLARGQPLSYDEYRRMVGLIQGLNLAIDRINDLVKRAERDDDDDDK